MKPFVILSVIVSCSQAFKVGYYTISLSDVGEFLADFNNGICLAFQNDNTDTSTVCYASCTDTGTEIETMFEDMDDSSSVSFNPSTAYNDMQVVILKMMSQFSDCKMTEFMFSIDNRFSDTAFTTGLATNFVTQLATTGFYYYMANYYTMDDFTTTQLANNVLYTLLTDIIDSDEWTATDGTQNQAIKVTNYMLQLIAYKSPNVSEYLDLSWLDPNVKNDESASE